MLKYIGNFSRDLSKYGFVRVNDYEVAYIHRNNMGNAFIDYEGCCLSIRNKKIFDPLIKDGLVIKVDDTK